MPDTCYDGLNRPYECDDDHRELSTAAKAGLGVGIAAAVLLIFVCCAMCRRKRLQQQLMAPQPPILPIAHAPEPPHLGSRDRGNGMMVTSASPYFASNPAPITPFTPYPALPGAIYRPSGWTESGKRGDAVIDSRAAHAHGYEWEQARDRGTIAGRGEQHDAPPEYSSDIIRGLAMGTTISQPASVSSATREKRYEYRH